MKQHTALSMVQRRRFLKLMASTAAASGLAACGGGGGDDATPETPAGSAPVTTPPATTPVQTPPATTPVETPPVQAPPVEEPAQPQPSTPVFNKSAKRGIAYDLTSAADMSALSPGVSWWYNWGVKPAAGVSLDYAKQLGMDYMPMLWNDDFDAAAIEAIIKASGVKYLLLLNEPNLVDQANMTPARAAALWPRYEAVAARTGVKLVGPAMTWGTLANYADPVTWLDAFYVAYRAANSKRDPQIDYLAYHWYDYGLADRLDSLKKYGKPVWVTEMANWHSNNDGAQIDTLAKQKTQMTEMVRLCEERSDVFRYAWFIGRMSPDPHFTSLLGANGQLTELGQLYVSLPFKAA